MTRYKEIRLVFNKKSYKNEGLSINTCEENENAAIELYDKLPDHSLEDCFIPRLIEAHDIYISKKQLLFVCSIVF